LQLLLLELLLLELQLLLLELESASMALRTAVGVCVCLQLLERQASKKPLLFGLRHRHRLALCREVQRRVVAVVCPCSSVVGPRCLFLVVEVSKAVLLASAADLSSPLAAALVPAYSSVLRSLPVLQRLASYCRLLRLLTFLTCSYTFLAYSLFLVRGTAQGQESGKTRAIIDKIDKTMETKWRPGVVSA
jgi:hypothetical protein